MVEHVNPTSTIIMNTVILLDQLYNYSFYIMKYIAAFLNGTDINKLWTLNKEWADNKRQVLMKGGIICNIHSGINLSNTLVSRVEAFTINIERMNKMNNNMECYVYLNQQNSNGNTKRIKKLCNIQKIEIRSDLFNYYITTHAVKSNDYEFAKKLKKLMDMLKLSSHNNVIKQLILKNIRFEWITGIISNIFLLFKGLTILHIEQVYNIDFDEQEFKAIQFNNLKHFIIDNCDIKIGIQVLQAAPYLNRVVIKYDENVKNTLMWKNNQEKIKIMTIASKQIEELEIDNLPIDLFYSMFNPTLNIQHQQLQSLYEMKQDRNNTELLLLLNIKILYLNEILGMTNHCFIRFQFDKLLSRVANLMNLIIQTNCDKQDYIQLVNILIDKRTTLSQLQYLKLGVDISPTISEASDYYAWTMSKRCSGYSHDNISCSWFIETIFKLIDTYYFNKSQVMQNYIMNNNSNHEDLDINVTMQQNHKEAFLNIRNKKRFELILFGNMNQLRLIKVYRPKYYQEMHKIFKVLSIKANNGKIDLYDVYYDIVPVAKDCDYDDDWYIEIAFVP